MEARVPPPLPHLPSPALKDQLLDAVQREIRERTPTDHELAVEGIIINNCHLESIATVLTASQDRQVPELSAGRLIHSIACMRHIDHLLRRGVWDSIVLPAIVSCPAATPQLIVNDLALTHFDYLTHRIKLD